MQLNAEALAGLSKRQRAALVNSLPGYKPAVLVGTQNLAGQTNLAIISSLFHVGASPPLLGMIIRPSPEGTDRHTLNNILSTGAYTLNSFTYADRKSAHHTSARFDGEQSEFDACGFTALHNDKLGAPFVKEAPLKVGCCLRDHQSIALNSTHLIIGEITSIDCPDAALRADGSLDLVGMGLAAVTGLDSYHSVNPGERFEYAKPTKKPGLL